MRVYISGKITGNESYKDVFDKAEKLLKSAGYDVINPARVDIPCLTWKEYMNIDLSLLDLCDAIVMLPGWETSKGACIERGYAMGRDKFVFDKPEQLVGKEWF